MTHKMAQIPVLVCTISLVCGAAAASAVPEAGADTVKDRMSGDQITQLRELLLAHEIPPAPQLAGEITRGISESNRIAAKTALYRPPVMLLPETAPARGAVAEFGEPGSARPAAPAARPETPSPLRDALRKLLRLLNFSN